MAHESLVTGGKSASFCAACDVSWTGGRCPNCGTVWWRNEDGKLVGARMDFSPQVPAPSADFWRNSGGLREAIPQARAMDVRLAEAIDALHRLWMTVAFRLLSGQQSAALLYCHSRETISSRQLSEALGISHQAASNVLQQLVEKELLTRSQTGRNVRYSLRILWPMGSTSKARRSSPGVFSGLLRDTRRTQWHHAGIVAVTAPPDGASRSTL
jgi:DNA-binding transcriptional ArsR family regulator